MKVVIPVAGLGSRLKPHTFTTSKALMEVAGKPVLSYVLEEIEKLNPSEVILIVGHHKQSIIDFVKKNFKTLNCIFKEQETLDGDGGALRVALDEIDSDEDLYVIFGADTLIDFNLKSELKKISNNIDAGVFAMKVEEPEHYGVMNVYSDDNIVYELEEKPEKPKSNLAIIGAYYFKSLKEVKSLLNNFYERKESLGGEYKIAQVLDSLIKNKEKQVKAIPVKKWFDCGRPEVILEANKYFLEKQSNNKIIKKGSNIIIPPCYIAKSSKLTNCVIGPNVSIGEGVTVSNSIIQNSIISHDSNLKEVILKDSLIGKQVELSGKSTQLNLGDRSQVIYK